jgi:hypothetical protein
MNPTHLKTSSPSHPLVSQLLLTMTKRINSESRRRSEASMDDQPMAPARSSAVLARDELAPLPFTDLYPTVSNLQRHGVVIGNPLDIGHQVNDDNDRTPNEISVPTRHIRRYLSEVTMAADLESFDGSEFERIPSTDDYLDDEELEVYLRQLAKEEERKGEQRESLKQMMSTEKEELQRLLLEMEGSSDSLLHTAANDEEYLNRLLEEQIQVEQQYKNDSAKRIWQYSC